MFPIVGMSNWLVAVIWSYPGQQDAKKEAVQQSDEAKLTS